MIVYHHMILTTIALVLMLMMTSSVVPAMELAYLLGIMIHIDLHALQLNQSAVRMRSPANRQTIINTDLVITNPCLHPRQVLLINLYLHQNLKTIGHLLPLMELVEEEEEEATGALGWGPHPKPVEMLTQLWQLC
jgi:hypothetical protein